MLQRLKELLMSATGEGGGSGGGSGADWPTDVAVAALLLESANADDHVHTLEHAMIAQALKKQFGLDADGVEDLIARAEQARREAIDLHGFTKVVLRERDERQRLAIAEVVWRVVLADGELTTDESILARRLGNLLELRPEDVSVAIQRARGRRTPRPRRS